MFLAGYVGVTLLWEDFTYYDNSMFTLYTLKGQSLAPPIWRNNGRFFPLGHQEFNVIRHFTETIAGYHVLPTVEILILSCILLFLDWQLSIIARAILAALVLVTPGVIVSFSSLIFTERNVVVWLVLLVFFVSRFEQTKTTAYAIAAVICAQFMVYYKETAFLLLMGFACGRLILRAWSTDRGTWDCKWFRDKDSRLDACLVFVGLAFLLYYTAVMLPHPNAQYADEIRLPRVEVVLGYLKVDPLAWLLGAILIARLYLILRQKAAPSLLWDGLAIGGTAYFVAYLYLGIFAAYYLAPVDVIAALYVGRFVSLSWRKVPVWIKGAICILLSTVLLQEAGLSACTLFEQKNVVHGKTEMALAVEAQYRRRTETSIRLFFPFASPTLVMQFTSYLSYLGVPIEGVTAKPGSANRVVVFSKAVLRDGRCVEYENVVCRAASRPERGDLVVVLPDDEASRQEVALYRAGGELLALYAPSPHVPRWLDPIMRYFRIVSPHWINGAPPDRWLNAVAILWR